MDIISYNPAVEVNHVMSWWSKFYNGKFTCLHGGGGGWVGGWVWGVCVWRCVGGWVSVCIAHLSCCKQKWHIDHFVLLLEKQINIWLKLAQTSLCFDGFQPKLSHRYYNMVTCICGWIQRSHIKVKGYLRLRTGWKCESGIISIVACINSDWNQTWFIDTMIWDPLHVHAVKGQKGQR